MLLGWIDLIRRPFNKRNDFVSLDAARSHTNNHPRNYEMITSPPSAIPKSPDPLITSPRPERDERPSQFPHSPPSPSSQYTTDYFGNKEVGSRNRHLSFSLPREADYKSPKLSFSTPRPPGAGRHQQPTTQTGRLSPGRPLSPTTGRESAGSTFSSAYEWDPTTTYAPPTTTNAHAASYGRPDAL